MKTIWTIAKKEYEHYFISPIAYIVCVVIIGYVGRVFYLSVTAAINNQFLPSLTIVSDSLFLLFLFTAPAITMHLIADEIKQGTLETLLTSPVRDIELILGKWLGAVLFTLTILSLTLIYPLILNRIISPGIDIGLLVSQYLGLILELVCMMAIGVFSSSLVRNQIASFFITLFIILFLMMLTYSSAFATNPNWFIQTLDYLSFGNHYSSFTSGIIQLKDVVYYISITAFALFLGTMSVETRRMR